MSDAPKPPYVTFEVRPIEDREKSLEAGHTVFKDEVYAIVTPAGTRDRLEKQVDDWLHNLDEGVQQNRIPGEWPAAYRHKLELFRKNQEMPEDGTPLENMTTLSPAEIRNIKNANVRTVEDLAEAAEEAVMRIGMGGRALKGKAKAWLDSAKGQGKTAAELDKLRVDLQQAMDRISSVEEQNTQLKSQVAAYEKIAEKTS